MRGSLIWLYISVITLTLILSKPEALFIFNDLNASKICLPLKGFHVALYSLC